MEQADEEIWSVTEKDWEVHKGFMYLRLKNAIEENRTLILTLEKLRRRSVLPQMAWINRNLLELDIWVEYASSSDARARQFWEDSIRDTCSLLTQGVSKKAGKSDKSKSFELSSLASEVEHDPDFTKLIRKAVGILSPNRAPDAWTAVSEAAKALGRAVSQITECVHK